MGLAAHQQHLEPVAHAVHHEGRAVILERELLRPRLDLHLDHVGSAVIDCDVDGRVAPDRHREGPGRPTVFPERHPRLTPRLRQRIREVVDAERDRNLLAHEAEARRFLDQEPAVLLARFARDQSMERRTEVEPLGRRHVVHLAVGDHDRACDALFWHVGKRLLERRIEPRARVGETGARLGAAGVHDPHVEISKVLQPLRHPVERLLGILAPIADAHARGVVDHHGGDVALWQPILLDQRGVGEDQQQDGRGEKPPDRSARSPHRAEQQRQDREPRESSDRPPGQ